MFKTELLFLNLPLIKRKSSVVRLIDLLKFKINQQERKKGHIMMRNLKKVHRIQKTTAKKAKGQEMSAGECSKELNIFLPRKIKVIYLPKSWHKFYLKVPL